MARPGWDCPASAAAHWFGSTADEQESGESLEQLLAEEEPGTALDIDDEQPQDITGDEDAGDEDVDGSSSMTARTPGRPGW